MIITVVGLGVIGGSYVKSLKGLGHEVYGVDKDKNTLDLAKAEGVIIEGYLDGSEIIERSDLTIICLYPSLVIDFIKGNKFKEGSIVNDAIGVKSFFLDKALSLMPQGVEFVSGHPMAGREKKGYEYASGDVFQGANYILINHPQNTKQAIEKMEKLISEIGFKSVKIMSPEAHDEIIAFTSQLPHAIAVALINSDDQRYETGKYIGDSYRDLTRIANINENLWSELFLENKENLVKKISDFENQLDIIKDALARNDSTVLKEVFKESSNRRNKL